MSDTEGAIPKCKIAINETRNFEFSTINSNNEDEIGDGMSSPLDERKRDSLARALIDSREMNSIEIWKGERPVFLGLTVRDSNKHSSSSVKGLCLRSSSTLITEGKNCQKSEIKKPKREDKEIKVVCICNEHNCFH